MAINIESLTHYQRSLTREFAREAPEGIGREAGRLTGNWMSIADEKVRYKVWQIDSLLFCLEELLAGRPLFAFRGLVQASGYAGKLEGMGAQPYSSTLADAFGTIKNAIEDSIKGDH